MKQKQSKDRWFKVPFLIFDLGLDHYELAVLTFLISKITGYTQDNDQISYSQIAKGTVLSKDKIVKVIKNLENKKYIKVDREYTIIGSKDINRYTLTFDKKIDGEVVRRTVKSSTSHGLGGSTSHGLGGSTPHGHTIEYIKERENKIFFLFDKKIKDKAIETYIKYIQHNSKNIKNEIAYNNKIRNNIKSNDKETIDGLMEWLENEAIISLSVELLTDETELIQGKYIYDQEMLESDKKYVLKKDRFYALLEDNRLTISEIKIK